MKKIALLLALLLTFTVFITACDDAVEENSENISDFSSESESGSEDNADPNNPITNISVDSNPKSTIVSTGASYSCAPGADEKYPDTYGTELTDGIRTTPISSNYQDDSLSGYATSSGRQTIILDLGYVAENIYSFKVGYLAYTGAGINAPGSATAYVSIDGKKWENIGRLSKPEFKEGTIQEAVLTLDKYVKARYVRFFVTGAASWFFLDEVMVVADVEGTNADVQFKEAVGSAYASLGAVARPEGTNDVDFDLDKTLVSEGASYTATGTQSENFKDTTGKMLTDGTVSGYYEGGSWVGFVGGSDVTVKLDLGKTIDDIASIEASFYTNVAVKLYMPVALKIAAIDESDNRTELGVLYANTVLTNGNYVFSLPFTKTISARYIEFTMVATESNMYLVEELAVYAYRETTIDSLYPTIVLDDESTEWGSGADNSYVNLIANKTQQILTATEPDKSQYSNNTSVNSALMTDGVKASKSNVTDKTNIHSGLFFKFCQGGGRTVIYDLEHISAVDKFTAYFTQNLDWSVTAPQTIQVYVSVNGSDWYQAGVMNKEGEASVSLYSYELELSKKVKARYVVFKFAVGSWAGCDELEVFGTKSTSGAIDASAAGFKKVTLISHKRMEPSDDLLGGSTDTCLLYQNADRYYTVDDLIPYLAYVDEDGVQQDTMFDSFLFLFIGDFPVGGGQAHQNGTKAGWEWALSDAFKEGQNLMAMEEAAGIVKENLQLDDDFKYKVSLTLYYPSLGVNNFGDVDGDGKTENLDNLEDRKKVMKWYIESIRETFDAQNFQNIELVGYYWFHEAIETSDTESIELLNSIADIVHDNDCDFFWIPWFTANGYNAWSDYGFDVAVMQPNYVFKLETPYSNVVNCAKLTELYGMGIEMELCSDCLTNERFFKKYMQYISAGAEYGYMNDSIVMYYQGVTDFRDACNSGTFMGRMIYDSTYHFIKGDLNYKPATLEKSNYTATMNTPLTGKFNFDNDKLRELAVFLTPDHGSVTVHNDGTFTYYPETDYTGEVTFSFIYSEYLGWSDPCEVVITIQ